jgi:hypothetical protein
VTAADASLSSASEDPLRAKAHELVTKRPLPDETPEVQAVREQQVAELLALQATLREAREQTERAREIVTVVDRATALYTGEEGFVEDTNGLFVPASSADIVPALRATDPQPGEQFVDLGSGDGRWVFAAAGVMALEAYGYELSAERHRLAEQGLRALANEGVLDEQEQARVHLMHGDALEADISGADIITYYAAGYPSAEGMELRIEQKLLREGKRDARVIVYGTGIKGHEMTRLTARVPDIPGLRIPATVYQLN